jgi:co-chaperonin GroES (HSP10)
MILAKGELPAAPRGHRILCLPDPPKAESECGLIIPDSAMLLPHYGTILHAGLNARDAMYDHGDEIGDRVWWGKFAGVMEEWDRLIEEKGAYLLCEHSWNRLASPGKNVHMFSCTHCKSVRRVDPLVVMNHDDILCNVDAEKRMREGKQTQVRGKTASGATQHYINRGDK